MNNMFGPTLKDVIRSDNFIAGTMQQKTTGDDKEA
jgi:hypothetical protein